MKLKFLSPRVHGYLDYAIVALLLFAPTLFGFAGVPAVLCYVLAAAQCSLSLLTRYPLGLARLIPFTAHGAIEAVTALGLVVAPWLLGFDKVDVPRNFFLAAGVGLSLVWFTTDYGAADRDLARRYPRSYDRHSRA